MNRELLAQITSPGLVRRAQKALLKSAPSIEEVDDAVVYDFENQQGKFVFDDIHRSVCSCNVHGICKHIIAVALYVLESKIELPCEPQREVVDVDAVLKNAGRALVRRLFKRHRLDVSVKVSQQTGVTTVDINQHTFSFINATRLADFMNAEVTESDKLLGFYHYCIIQKIKWHWPDWLLQEQEQKAVDKHQQQSSLLADLRQVLKALWWQGVPHIQPLNLLDIELLVVPLKKVGLTEHSLACKRVIGAYRRYISGEGVRDEQAVIYELSLLLVLLERDPAVDKAMMESKQSNDALFCLGPLPWKSVGGAHGLSLVFQSASGQVYTAAEARSKAAQSLQVGHIAKNLCFWDRALPAMKLMGKRVNFNNIEVNEQHHISRKQSVSVASIVAKEPFIAHQDFSKIDWSQQRYLIIAPKAFHHFEFNQALQEFVICYRDRFEGRVSLTVPFDGEQMTYMENIAWLENQPVALLACQLVEKSNQCQLRPFAIKTVGKTGSWHSLYFESMLGNRSMPFRKWLATMTTGNKALPIRKVSQLELVLAEFAQWLSGFPHTRPEQKADWLVKLEQMGLTQLSHLLRREDDFALLRCVYMLHCLRQYRLATPFHPCD